MLHVTPLEPKRRNVYCAKCKRMLEWGTIDKPREYEQCPHCGYTFPRKIVLAEATSLDIQRTATNLLMNYIALVPGVPTRMHFTDDYWVDRTIADRESGKPKTIKSLVFWVDELNGEDCARTFSILSQKLDAHITPYLPDKEYTLYDFLITKIGDGFLADFNVQLIRRPEGT